MRAYVRRLDAVHHMKTKQQTTARTEISQTNVTRGTRRVQVSTLCVAAAMLCATALSPILPVEAQTCMTESLLYTYDDEPAAKPHKTAQHKSAKKSAAKVATAKVQSSSNNAVTDNSSQSDQTQTAAATTAGQQAVQIAGSLTAMRNHP